MNAFTSSENASAASIMAALGYVKPMQARPFAYAYEPPAGEPWENYERDLRSTRISDARCFPAAPSLEVEGFELRDAPSAVADFFDPEAVRSVYYREAAELARAVTGGTRAYIFDHLVRRREAGRPPLGFGRSSQAAFVAANGQLHNDYTEASGRDKLALVIEDARLAASVGRYSIVNIWRPVGAPVLDTPLALCDARTVTVGDLVSAEVRYRDRTGEIYLLRHAARHRWCYFHAMQPGEALIFKQYDSQVSGVARFVPHGAFDHPHVPPGAPLRQSIEVRCLVLYDVER